MPNSSPQARVLLVSVLLVLALPPPALAAEGVIEINQACAVNTGCTPDDAPGFPVTLRKGSYRLTSALQVAEPAPAGINIVGSRVVIDFAGFSMSGDPTGALQNGITSVSGTAPRMVTIQNGRIEDFDGSCIEVGDSSRIENMTLNACGVHALSIGERGLVIGNRILGNGGQVLEMGSTTLYRDNQIDEAIGAGTVTGGTPSGVNICGSGTCARYPPLRRYYLTPDFALGNQPGEPGFCAPGFHFASIFELADIGSLQYDTRFAAPPGDLGEGPSSSDFQGLGTGWVRTGFQDSSDQVPGTANCDGWTTSFIASYGTQAIPTTQRDPLTESSRQVGVWRLTAFTCGFSNQVWCIED